jgi:hypothetical protein
VSPRGGATIHKVRSGGRERDTDVVSVVRRRLFPGLWAWRILSPFNNPQSDILLDEFDCICCTIPILNLIHLHLPPRIHRPDLRSMSSRALWAGVSNLSGSVLQPNNRIREYGEV